MTSSPTRAAAGLRTACTSNPLCWGSTSRAVRSGLSPTRAASLVTARVSGKSPQFRDTLWRVRFAIYLPTVKEFADVRLLADLAYEAEQTGWDGVFVWDVLSLSLEKKPWPQVDAWTALAAIAGSTTRIRIGPIVEAMARRRPWKLARETVSVDRLSRGRLVLGVGLGADPESEFAAFGED